MEAPKNQSSSSSTKTHGRQSNSSDSTNEEEGNAPTEWSKVSGDIIMDYTSEFTTYEIYKSRANLLKWVRETGRRNGFVITIAASDPGSNGKSPRLTLACERSGSYKPKKDKSKFKRTSTGTKKCGCPFKLKGRKLPTDDDWMLVIICGVHNHPVTEYLEGGHSYVGRLNGEETALLLDMSKTLARPRDILNTLKARDPLNATTMRTIYNARQKYRVVEKVSKLQIQYLLDKLYEHKYFEWHRTCKDGTNTVMDLFWAHPTSIDFLRTFPRVLILDTTYKTNRYHFPLFEIIGVTSTNMTFSVAFVFLAAECVDNYTWALGRLRSIMENISCEMPDVMVTNRELALMNAIEIVFPSVRHLLCRWHIGKNVLAKCKKWFDDKDTFEQFMGFWKVIVGSKSEVEYNQHSSYLHSHFMMQPQAIEYVTDTWLDPYRDRFVATLTNTCMHFGNTTTNRADSAHTKLKRQLGSSLSNFEIGWSKIHALLELHFTDIKTSFEKSLAIIQHDFKPELFRELKGFVSIAALEIILKQSKMADRIGVDSSACGCEVRRTHGLPCAHEIAMYKKEGRPIPFDCIDPHWRSLSIIPAEATVPEPDFVLQFELYKEILDEYDGPTRMQMLKKIREIFHPQKDAGAALNDDVQSDILSTI